MMLTDCMYQEKKEVNDSQALKIALTQLYNDYIEKRGGRMIVPNTRSNRTEITIK